MSDRLRRNTQEGGISGRGGVSGTASNGAGANPNYEAKSGVRDTKLTAKVIVWVTPKLTKSTINLLVRLMVTLDVTSISVDCAERIRTSLTLCEPGRCQVG